ncbi:hypothetical protein T12_11946 [Trichinella patagoniensis]|uniref:Uncharacterized protein n=1 Tax=Trichinella patagoniensis TaxID=990121 RepID=A0A0V1A498_9BILA|nr:hypothetical protein T12_11946 [Trichinella patagoniensis]
MQDGNKPPNKSVMFYFCQSSDTHVPGCVASKNKPPMNACMPQSMHAIEKRVGFNILWFALFNSEPTSDQKTRNDNMNMNKKKKKKKTVLGQPGRTTRAHKANGAKRNRRLQRHTLNSAALRTRTSCFQVDRHPIPSLSFVPHSIPPPPVLILIPILFHHIRSKNQIIYT